MNKPPVAAFVCFGEVNTPKEILAKKCREAQDQLSFPGIELLFAGPVTDDAGAQDVQRAIRELKTKSFDLLILCIAGWIPSHAVIAVSHEFRSKPMVLWGLAGEMEDGRLVTTAAQAGTTALRKVFEDLGYRFIYCYNIPGKQPPVDRIKSFALAAAAVHPLENMKAGMMGFRDMRLYNTLYEGISLKARFGIEVDFFEMWEMIQTAGKTGKGEMETVLERIRQEWDFEKPADQGLLRKGISYYLAIRKIAEEKGYHALSLKDVDGMKKLLDFPPAMIFMLLSDEMKICTIPENDTMGSVTQLIVKQLTGQCAAYLEFYEFFGDSVLMGVPDFVPSEVVEGRVKVLPAAFGDIGVGILNVSVMRTGRLTMARLSNSADRYAMHIFTGEGKLKAWEEAGWAKPAPQLPSLEIFMDTTVDDLATKVSGQHYILAYGDHTQVLKDFCLLKDIPVV